MLFASALFSFCKDLSFLLKKSIVLVAEHLVCQQKSYIAEKSEKFAEMVFI
jgi:hypothetical protein